jgi:hypothetical protein
LKSEIGVALIPRVPHRDNQRSVDKVGALKSCLETSAVTRSGWTNSENGGAVKIGELLLKVGKECI